MSNAKLKLALLLGACLVSSGAYASFAYNPAASADLGSLAPSYVVASPVNVASDAASLRLDNQFVGELTALRNGSDPYALISLSHGELYADRDDDDDRRRWKDKDWKEDKRKWKDKDRWDDDDWDDDDWDDDDDDDRRHRPHRPPHHGDYGPPPRPYPGHGDYGPPPRPYPDHRPGHRPPGHGGMPPGQAKKHPPYGGTYSKACISYRTSSGGWSKYVPLQVSLTNGRNIITNFGFTPEGNLDDLFIVVDGFNDRDGRRHGRSFIPMHHRNGLSAEGHIYVDLNGNSYRISGRWELCFQQLR